MFKANIKLILQRALIRSTMSYAFPAWESVADTYHLKLQRLQNKVLRIIVNFKVHTGLRFAHGFQPSVCIRLYNKNCAGNKKKSYKITRMNMFAVCDTAKPDIENIRCLNLAVVKLTTVQVTKLPL
jgi:hypothetical protein